MNDKDIPACQQSCPLLGLGSSDGLGPAPEAARLVEYLKGYPLTDGVSAAIRVLLEQAAEIEALRAAALGVVVHMEGRQPVRGWLMDNDKSRDALAELVRVLGA